MTSLSAFKGINNVANENKVPDGYLRECVDFSIDNSTYCSQRPGFSKKISGNVTSLYSDNTRCFAVIDNELVEINNDYSKTNITTMQSNDSVKFCRYGDNYYFVGTNSTGVIDGKNLRSFGINPVTKQPTLTEVSGGLLNKGNYLVAVTYLDSEFRESGTTAPSLITLTNDNSAIRLTNFVNPPNNGVTYRAIYMSSCNGTELYRLLNIDIATTSATIYDTDESGMILETINVMLAPRGKCIAEHFGVIYIANGNRLYYSMPKAVEWFKEDYFYEYDHNITALMPCESGMYVATEGGLYWLAGRTPDFEIENAGDMSQIKICGDHFYLGSETKIPKEFLETPTYAWCATSERGLWLLNDGGMAVNVTQKNIKLPEFENCTGAFVITDDCARYLSMISGHNVPARAI